MKFTIQVNGPAYGSQASYHAYRFTQAALRAGHQINRVFFYQDGVLNSSALSSPASDEFDIVNAWVELHTQHQVRLINCVSAALRRGVLSQSDANELQQAHWNMHSAFEMGGLGELVSGIEKSERLISF